MGFDQNMFEAAIIGMESGSKAICPHHNTWADELDMFVSLAGSNFTLTMFLSIQAVLRAETIAPQAETM